MSSRLITGALCLIALGYGADAWADRPIHRNTHRPVHRITTAYPDGLTDDPADWGDCRPLERQGADPNELLPPDEGPPHPADTTWGDCLCTRDTVRLEAAIKGFTFEGTEYVPGDVEIEGTIYLEDPSLYPGDPDEVAACTFFLGGPRIRDSVELRGVESNAGPPTINGPAIAIWTARPSWEPQPPPAEILIEGLWFVNTGPAVQTRRGSLANVTLRDLHVRAPQVIPQAPWGCPANALQFVIHHTGSLLMENVSARSQFDPNSLPVPQPGPPPACPLPGRARAVGVAVGLASNLDVLIRESSFEVVDLEDAPLEEAAGLYILGNADTSIRIDETTIVAGRGVYAWGNNGPLIISESAIQAGATAISVDAVQALLTNENSLTLTGDGVGIRVGSSTGPSYLVEDVLMGEAVTGIEISGYGHQLIETDLSDLDAQVAVELTDESVSVTVSEVDGEPIVDHGTDNTVER